MEVQQTEARFLSLRRIVVVGMPASVTGIDGRYLNGKFKSESLQMLSPSTSYKQLECIITLVECIITSVFLKEVVFKLQSNSLPVNYMF